MEDGGIDGTRVKAIFYALFFGAENLGMGGSDYRAFADCFVRYETRAVEDEEGNKTGKTHTVVVSLKSLPEIYGNLENTLLDNEPRPRTFRLNLLKKWYNVNGKEECVWNNTAG